MPSQSPPSESQRADRLNSAYLSRQRVHGLTHPVYRYPARFSPEFVNACVSAFTEGGDIVLDPFVGGGTSAVEAMAAGRRFVGFDLNPLAILLTRAKTTPLSRADAGALSDWIERSFASDSWDPEPDDRLKNAPPDIARALVGPVHAAGLLPSERQRDAARAILLDVGQWAIDGRASPASPARLKDAANDALRQLLVGLADLEAAANDCGLKPSDLPNRRVLRAVPARDAASHRGLNRLAGRVRLVVTSPPYPGVHVLYHRWQVGGRAETPMPYWLADQRDGLGPKHYTMGGRSAVGQVRV